MKVELLIEGKARPYSWNPDLTHVIIRQSLPFFQSRSGKYVHRVRSAMAHYFYERYKHTSFKFWCGGTGFDGKGSLLETPPAHATFCATCEGRAIGAGLCGAPVIAGRAVRFAPKHQAVRFKAADSGAKSS